MRTNSNYRRLNRAGFTIRELLIAILAAAILLSIVLPSLASSREGSGIQTSMSNLMQIGVGQFMYAMEWNGRQYAAARDELGYFGANPFNALQQYESQIGPHPGIYLGWDEVGLWLFPLNGAFIGSSGSLAVPVQLDSDTPFLHVDNLLQENTSGVMSISSFFTGAYFSNFSFVEDDSVALIGSSVAFDAWPENLVTSWQVSTSTVLATSLDQAYWLGDDQLGAVEWTKLDVEANGVANLAHVNGVTEDGNTVFVRMVIHSDKDQVKHLRYGFSDKAKAYVNGKLVAGGDDTYQTRDYRYLGTVGLFDSLYLHLNEGQNEVVFAITEAFGGWAIVGAFDDMEGIALE